MVGCRILFLAVLISTDLAGQMASSVDYISIATYVNYLLILTLSPYFLHDVLWREVHISESLNWLCWPTGMYLAC